MESELYKKNEGARTFFQAKWVQMKNFFSIT